MKPLPGLDVLCGLTALLIVVHHATSDVIPDLPDTSGAAGFILWRIRNLGWSGIDLFFVLGAFFMAGSMFADLNGKGCVRTGRYWRRRAIRIVPSYYFLLLVLAVTGATGYIDFSDAFSSIKGILIVVSGWSYNIYLWHYFLPSLLGTPYVRLQLLIHTAAS